MLVGGWLFCHQNADMPKTVVIIGAGLVGLATAYKLQKNHPNLKIIVIEKEEAPAMHQSGHNSGVIHSGIYYKPGSLKALNCMNGYHQMVDFCRNNDIPHQICGKLIVAVNKNEEAKLSTLQNRAKLNGLKDIQLLNHDDIRRKEPFVQAKSALWVPQTGVVDYKKVAICIADKLKENGAEIFFNQKVTSIHQVGNGLTINTTAKEFNAHLAVNCAGLYSDEIAMMAGLKLQHRIIPFRGEYWMLSDEASGMVKGLIYPVPNPDLPFLGVHLTRMVDGKVEAGPNAVLALKKEGYVRGEFSAKEALSILSYPGLWKMAIQFAGTGAEEMLRAKSKQTFLRAVQQLIPELKDPQLLPAPAGVRAQALLRNGQLADDFIILESPKMIHVCNAPSPAATACFSIGDFIGDRAKKMM
jgi:L-2-hydroxyglutarate oxidase